MTNVLSLMLAGTAHLLVQNGGWSFVTNKDPITDKASSKIVAASTDGKSRLTFKCDAAAEQVVSIQYGTQNYLGGGRVTVQLRADNAPPLTMSWEAQGRVAYNRDERDVASLAKVIASSRTVFVRVFDDDMQPRDASFEIGGGAMLLQTIFADCGYEDPLAKAR